MSRTRRSPISRSRNAAALAVALLLALGAAESAAAATRAPAATPPSPLLQHVDGRGAPWWQHPAERQHVQPTIIWPGYRDRGWHRHAPRHRFAPRHPYRPHAARGACRPVTLVGLHHGRRALFSGLVCFDRHGGARLVPGSRAFIRHLHR